MSDERDASAELTGQVESASNDRDLSSRSCFFCGESLKVDAHYCSECDRYQPSPLKRPLKASGSEDTKDADTGTKDTGDDDAERMRATKECCFCGEWIPYASQYCSHCKTFQRGYRSLLPISATTVSALATLISVLILLISNLDKLERKLSKTEAILIGEQNGDLLVLSDNRGNQSSLIGPSWLRVDNMNCDWNVLCPDEGSRKNIPITGPSDTVLELRVADLATALAKPGSEVKYVTLVDPDLAIPPDHYPSGLDDRCEQFGALLPSLMLCLAIEIREYRHEDFRCERINAPASRYQEYVRTILGC